MSYYFNRDKYLFNHRNIKYFLIILVIFNLTSCSNHRTNKLPLINLPEMPLISKETNIEFKELYMPKCNKIKLFVVQLKEDVKSDKDLITELERVCMPKSDQIKIWLDELYMFKVKYDIYRLELRSN